jgi:Zn-dependent protease
MLAISPPREAFTFDLLHSFLEPNLWLMAANLLPVAPLDGAEAWKLGARLRNLRRRRVAAGVIEVAATSRVKGEVARILDEVKDNTKSG